MDVGVYYRDNTMNDWTPFTTNLPNVEISEFEIHEPTNKIRAATYGRGIWESVIPPMVGNVTAVIIFLKAISCIRTILTRLIRRQ